MSTRDPRHIGANHYYIHAVEAAKTPGRALTSAKRLDTLVPAAGHLVHMPAHIYMRTGNYDGAVVANGGSAMSGYAAYARAPVPATGGSGDNGQPGAPVVVGKTTDPPAQ